MSIMNKEGIIVKGRGLAAAIQAAESGDYYADYMLRRALVEYGCQPLRLSALLPKEGIGFLRRAWLRDIGQTIQEALDSGRWSEEARQVLREGLASAGSPCPDVTALIGE